MRHARERSARAAQASERGCGATVSACLILSCLLVQPSGAGRAQGARRADPRGQGGPHQPRGGSCMPLSLRKRRVRCARRSARCSKAFKSTRRLKGARHAARARVIT
eukprot:scaffold2043_cov63-Phaeocystis_antarctica.AAC.1